MACFLQRDRIPSVVTKVPICATLEGYAFSFLFVLIMHNCDMETILFVPDDLDTYVHFLLAGCNTTYHPNRFGQTSDRKSDAASYGWCSVVDQQKGILIQFQNINLMINV